MERRQRRLERHAERLRDSLKAQMERTGTPRLKNHSLTLRVQANPPGVVVEDERRLPGCYKQPVITVRVLRAEIARALKAGQEVSGARLERTTRLVIA
jgi:hypothetical protein